MTQVFLIVVRALLALLVAFWTWRLWAGTESRAARAVGMLFSLALLWQVVGGTF